MLGLRFYRNRQIDVWQGPPSGFVVDFAAGTISSDFDSLAFSDAMTKAYESRQRHVSFEVISHRNEEDCHDKICDKMYDKIFEKLKDFLSHLPPAEKSKSSFSRITFIVQNRDLYKQVQGSLFRIFEDTLDETHH